MNNLNNYRDKIILYEKCNYFKEGRSNGLTVNVGCSFEPLPHTPDGVRKASYYIGKEIKVTRYDTSKNHGKWS